MYQEGEAIFIAILIAIVSGGIGALIGRNRKIGAGWAFVLCALFSAFGWIITASSEKKEVTEFEDMSKK